MAGGGGGGGGGGGIIQVTSFIGARCRRTDPQSIPGDAVGYDIDWQELVYPSPSDLVDFSFTAGINPYLIINTGIYAISSCVALSGNAAGSYRDTRIILFGSGLVPPHGNFDTKGPTGAFYTAHNLYTEVELLAGWRVGVQVFQNAGVNLSVDPFPDAPSFTLRRLR